MKVFWSWQSDTPGNVGRHFIRGALDDAITALKQAPDIEEPTNRATREALHVDQDRSGVPGSPDLARTILEKIERSSVFVADVTPVGATLGKEGKSRKKLINPNVAIELGYALHALTDHSLLMIMNEHFGSLEDLPFDLRHKAGPIRFQLAPDASKEKIAQERRELAGNLKSALRAYLRPEFSATALSFPELEPKASAAAYFDIGEPLGTLGDPKDDQVEFSYASTNGLYLRVIPTQRLPAPLRLASLVPLVIRSHELLPLDKAFTQAFRQRNKYGAIVFEPGRQAHLKASTQVFENGEIWGFNAHLFSHRSKSAGNSIHSYDVEQSFAATLTEYLRFSVEGLKLDQPLTVEAGLTGIEGAYIDVDDQRRWGPIRKDSFSHRAVLNAPLSESARTQFLMEFFTAVYDLTGYARPNGLHGFPP